MPTLLSEDEVHVRAQTNMDVLVVNVLYVADHYAISHCFRAGCNPAMC